MVPLATRTEDFSLVIDGIRRAGFAGVNVTVPHKEAAFAIAHRVDQAAKSAGAANLLVFHGKEIEARNTDHIGLATSLTESLGATTLRHKKAIVLGAGGAARAAVLALDSLEVDSIHVLNRNPARAMNFAREMSGHTKAELLPDPLDAKTFANVSGTTVAALLINTTSAGMGANPPLDIDLSVLPKSAAVCDIVYNPLQTKLLKDAAALGHKTIDGLGMLMHQAVPSFEAFFGVRPNVTPALREALIKALNARG
jgi:shikimate dehydrogenase